MMPVPAGAARRKTLPAPWRPATSWWSVRPSRRVTRIRLRLAASVAFRIASGTSRALPWPKPTRPFSSPTTTSAAKPKRRPPFTTLATRLMWTSLSVNSLSSRSRSRSRSRPCGSRAMIVTGGQMTDARDGQPEALRRDRGQISIRPLSSVVRLLEFQPDLAGGIRQGLDAAVVEVAAPVEDHVLDAFRNGTLSDELADRLRRRDVGASLEAPAHVLLERGGRRDRRAPLV